jgi:class 3 adenylate cyclase/tetratricopeptide (TPR) repeat protein
MSALPTGTVTLLFTDIEGSTRLVQQLDERYGDVLTQHHSLLRAVFAAFDGYEVSTEGDAFFVAFERAPQALAAAAAVQRALAAHPWPEGVAVRVRIGLHTGEPALAADNYVGIDVHRAARICACGHGGQVLVSEATAGLVRDELPPGVQLRALGEHRLKDFDHAEPIFQCVIDALPSEFPPLRTAEAWASIARTDDDVPHPLERLAGQGFVGRKQELGQLTTELDAVLAGHGRLVLLAGEPGIGKTRLAAELAFHARRRAVRVFWGRCWEGDGAPAFWPWVQILRSLLATGQPHAVQAAMGRGAADLAHVVPEVRELLPDLAPPPLLESEQARFRLFDSITAFLKNSAAEQPLLLVLDDLHWADKPSLLLLQFLVRELGQARILVTGTYRDVEIDQHHPLAEILAALRREPLHERIVLQGLAAPEVTALVTATTQGDVDARVMALIDDLHRGTNGNPLFIQEMLRHLVETGRIYTRNGLWTTDAVRLTDLAIADGVREVIGSRLSRLSEPCNRLLTVAAVAGREFSLELLEGVVELDEDAVLDAIEEASAAHIVAEVPGNPGRYRFVHALIRETLYQNLSAVRRLRLHRRVGESLEDLYSRDPEPYLAELAYHFAEAAPGGDTTKAVDYAVRAAQRAARLLAYEEAAVHYTRALRVLEARNTVDEWERCDLLLRLGEMQGRAGESDAAGETFRQAAELARRLNWPEGLAIAALGSGRITTGAVDTALVAQLEEALRGLDERNDALRVRLLARLSAALYPSDAQDRVASLSQEAVALARQLDDPALLATALNARRLAIWGPDSLAEQLAIATEIVALAERVGDVGLAARGHESRLICLLEMGDAAAADRELEVQQQLAENLRQPSYRWSVLMLQAMRALFTGRFADAERLAGQALSVGEKVLRRDATLYFGAQMWQLRREQGRGAEVEPAVRDFVDRYPGLPSWRAGLATLYADLGRTVEARREYEMVVDSVGSLKRDNLWLCVVALLAETCAFLGDAARAATLYRLLRPYADRAVTIGLPVCLGSASYYLGLLAATLQDEESAARHFQAALTQNAAMGSRPYVARTQYAYAAMLLRDLPGNLPDGAPRAPALLGEALAGAQQLGMASLVARITDLDRLAHDARVPSS